MIIDYDLPHNVSLILKKVPEFKYCIFDADFCENKETPNLNGILVKFQDTNEQEKDELKSLVDALKNGSIEDNSDFEDIIDENESYGCSSIFDDDLNLAVKSINSLIDFNDIYTEEDEVAHNVTNLIFTNVSEC
jgi:hypothetical protein